MSFELTTFACGLLLAGMICAGPAGSASFTWDPTSGDGQATEGSGNWDTATSNRSIDGGASNTTVAGNNPSAEDLKFCGGTAGTPGTITRNQNALQFGSTQTITRNAGTYDIDPEWK